LLHSDYELPADLADLAEEVVEYVQGDGLVIDLGLLQRGGTFHFRLVLILAAILKEIGKLQGVKSREAWVYRRLGGLQRTQAYEGRSKKIASRSNPLPRPGEGSQVVGAAGAERARRPLRRELRLVMRREGHQVDGLRHGRVAGMVGMEIIPRQLGERAVG
jgi:hypothetical protein